MLMAFVPFNRRPFLIGTAQILQKEKRRMRNYPARYVVFFLVGSGKAGSMRTLKSCKSLCHLYFIDHNLTLVKGKCNHLFIMPPFESNTRLNLFYELPAAFIIIMN